MQLQGHNDKLHVAAVTRGLGNGITISVTKQDHATVWEYLRKKD
jgi:hypothetical protein